MDYNEKRDLLKAKGLTDDEILKVLPAETNTDKVLNFLKDPSSKDSIEKLNKIILSFFPNPLYRVVGDLLIGGACFFVILLSAHWNFIGKDTVPSLLSLVVGAIVGARFKTS